VVKRVVAYQVERMMNEQNLTKTEMSRLMNNSRAALDCLLDPPTSQLLSKPLSGLPKPWAVAWKLHWLDSKCKIK